MPAKKKPTPEPEPEVAASWPRHAKIAFIGSHGIRKTSALLAFAAEVQRAGLSVELGLEVVRDNPLGINERASGEAQLWVLVSQIRQELELAQKADVLATDRGVMDNFAYYLRACGGRDAFDAVAWARTAQAASARFGAMALALPIAGDGETTASWELTTQRGGRAELRIVLDAASGELVEAALRASERAAPPEGW